MRSHQHHPSRVARAVVRDLGLRRARLLTSGLTVLALAATGAVAGELAGPSPDGPAGTHGRMASSGPGARALRTYVHTRTPVPVTTATTWSSP